MEHLPARAHDLVDRLDHVHGNADRARLVRDRARDSLTDPPRRVGRELVAAPVLELVHRLHQPDIALLDQVQELQAAVRVLLGDGDHEAKIGLHHLLLGDGGLAFALLHLVHDAAILGDVEPGFRRQRMDLAADFADRIALALDELGPVLAARGDVLGPVLVQLARVIGIEEVVALDAVAFGQPQQPPLEPHQALVDVVELFDQALDARGIEAQRLHVGDHRRAEAVDLLGLGAGHRLRAVGGVLVLQLAHLAIGVGDAVEGLDHLRLELGFHRAQRQRILEIVVVVLDRVLRRLRLFRHVVVVLVAAGGAARRGLRRLGPGRGGGSRGRHRLDRHHRRGLLGVGAGIGRLEIDDVAQQDFRRRELVAPDDDGLEGQRALAQPLDHRLAAGLDTLGDGDLALAAQQLHRAHLAQIHAHRIVGAVAALARIRLAGDGSAGALGQFRRFFLGGLRLGLFDLVLVDDVDAHVREHRHDVLDLVGRHFLRRQHRVDLFIGHIAALLGRLDELLDRCIGQIQQRAVGRFGAALAALLRRFVGVLGGFVLRLLGSGLEGRGFGGFGLSLEFGRHGLGVCLYFGMGGLGLARGRRLAVGPGLRLGLRLRLGSRLCRRPAFALCRRLALRLG